MRKLNKFQYFINIFKMSNFWYTHNYNYHNKQRESMKSTDTQPVYETFEIGTPLDYTSDMYRVYFEVREHDSLVLKILTEFLGEEKASGITALPHGYELELPIQVIPEVVKVLSQNNIAVYQVVRYAKTNRTWE